MAGVDPKDYKDDDAETPATEANSEAPVNLTQAQFAKALGDAVAEGMAKNQGPRKITFGEYARNGATPFHPKGQSGMPKPSRVYMQNGWPMPLAQVHDDEIRLLNRITHSGRYLERKVEVIVNTDTADESVDIRFSNTLAHAFELKGLARNFKDMLQQIVDAQEMEDLELEERNEQKGKGRVFGSSKTSQTARNAAQNR